MEQNPVSYNRGLDEDAHKTFNSLVTYNNGVWKSEAQAGFWLLRLRDTKKGEIRRDVTRYDYDEQQEIVVNAVVDSWEIPLDIPLPKGKRWIETRGSITFAVRAAVDRSGYGGYRPIGKVFIIDGQGVYRVYKLHYKQVGRSGFKADYYEVLFERNSDDNIDHWEAHNQRLKAREKAIKKERAATAKALAESGPLKEGRQVLTGKFITLKGYEGRFGYQTTFTQKGVFLTENGWRIFMSATYDMLDAVGVQTWDDLPRKTFTVKVTVEPKDAEFGFGKRPTVVKEKPKKNPMRMIDDPTNSTAGSQYAGSAACPHCGAMNDIPVEISEGLCGACGKRVNVAVENPVPTEVTQNLINNLQERNLLYQVRRGGSTGDYSVVPATFNRDGKITYHGNDVMDLPWLKKMIYEAGGRITNATNTEVRYEARRVARVHNPKKKT